MSQILWIGCLESDEEFEKKAKKGYDLASAQVSQKNLISGIEHVSGLIFDSINGAVLPHYPIYADKIIKPVKWCHKETSYDISVGYRNYKYYNRISCKNSMIKAARSWIMDRYIGDELIVLVYSMRSGPMATACVIKDLVPKARLYLIVTDLPQFMDLGQSRIKSFLKRIDWVSINKMKSYFDGFILYAEKMAEFLNIPDNKWLLMEGSYDIGESLIDNSEKKKAVMYSGKLDEQYGIKMLLHAFMSIPDSDIELWLTGGGNAESYIKECAQKDTRIKFFGFLPSRQDVLKKQNEASLLVNMRLPSEPASAYCFPSKLFEYMATGTPVLSFDIDGIPREYLPYLYFIENETIDDLVKGITDVLALSEEDRKCIGNNAAYFVREQKNTINQCRKIWEFINR